MTAYYNEIDPHAAQWLRNLIEAGDIAAGDVDERSIVDVRPSDLKGYAQCHFFAGVGVWSYALRRNEWPDDRPVWTGSCPCQPLSQAGSQKGFADERHLWPDWFWLISQCRPPVVFGEQVASPLGLTWIDLVQSDMEGTDHAFWAPDLCSAGIGAPHIRQRLHWMAYTQGGGSWAGLRDYRPAELRRLEFADHGGAGVMADTESRGQRKFGDALEPGQSRHIDSRGDAPSIVADSDLADPYERDLQRGGQFGGAGSNSIDRAGHEGKPGPTNGFWRDADWLYCRDGKWRPVEPGTFPLVDGASFKLGSGSAWEGKSRTGMLRGYGNAVNAELTTEFICAGMAALPHC